MAFRLPHTLQDTLRYTLRSQKTGVGSRIGSNNFDHRGAFGDALRVRAIASPTTAMNPSSSNFLNREATFSNKGARARDLRADLDQLSFKLVSDQSVEIATRSFALTCRLARRQNCRRAPSHFRSSPNSGHIAAPHYRSRRATTGLYALQKLRGKTLLSPPTSTALMSREGVIKTRRARVLNTGDQGHKWSPSAHRSRTLKLQPCV